MFYNNYKDRVGKNGEKFAEKYLKKRGYLFIARNYWTEYGEIDLVFWHNFSLIFVEVKTRSSIEFGTGREAVDNSKKESIISSSKVFIKSHCIKNKAPFYLWKLPLKLKYRKLRYDVIEVSANEISKYTIRTHLKGYFGNKKMKGDV